MIRLNRMLWPVTTLGPGRRLGLWVQGCSLRCEGCASLDTWDPDGGSSWPIDALAHEVASILQAESLDGISLTGGEPVQQAAPVADLLDTVTGLLGEGPDVVLFTGYTLAAARREAPSLLERCGTVVAGPFRPESPSRRLLVATSNQEVAFADDAAHDRFSAWEQTSPQRLQIAVDDRDLYVVGIPTPGDLDRLAVGLERRGVSFESLSWRA